MEKSQLNLKKYLIFAIGILSFAFLATFDIRIPRIVLIAFGALAIIVLFFASLNRVETALLALTLYIPFSRIIDGDFGFTMRGLNLTNILMLIIIFGWMSQASRNNERFFTHTPLNIPLFLFLLLSLVSLSNTFYRTEFEYFSEATIAFKRWTDPIILYFLFVNTIKDKKTIKDISFIIILATIVVSLLAIWEYMDRASSNFDNSRISAICGDPNSLGAFFAYYTPLIAGLFLVNLSSFKHWFLLFPMLLCFRGLQVTFSRGAYIALAGAGLALTFFRNKFLFLVSVAGLIFAILNPTILPSGAEYLIKRTFKKDVKVYSIEESVDTSFAGRLIGYKATLKMIADHPIFGVGYHRFPEEIGNYEPRRSYRDPHDTYLAIAAERGLPTLAAFLLIILIMLKNTWWVYRHLEDKFLKGISLGFLGSIFALLFSCLFGSRLNTLELAGYFWILAALMMKLKILIQEEKYEQRLNLSHRFSP